MSRCNFDVSFQQYVKISQVTARYVTWRTEGEKQ